jgi:gustatory receptor
LSNFLSIKIILFFRTGEHLLSMIVGTHAANNCPAIRDPIKAFYINAYPYVFSKFEYSGLLGSLLKLLNVAASFAWSYTDLFVILVSIGLASKFRQINEHLAVVKGKYVNSNFWSEYRLYYREVSNLVSTVDAALSKIILISISNNLFFICVQLLRSLE